MASTTCDMCFTLQLGRWRHQDNLGFTKTELNDTMLQNQCVVCSFSHTTDLTEACPFLHIHSLHTKPSLLPFSYRSYASFLKTIRIKIKDLNTAHFSHYWNICTNFDCLRITNQFSYKLWLHSAEYKIKGTVCPWTGHDGPEGVRGIALLFNLGARWEWVINLMTRQHYPRERPGTHCIGDWVDPRAGQDRYTKPRTYRDSIPGPFGP
jgi:hypothetical protein